MRSVITILLFTIIFSSSCFGQLDLSTQNEIEYSIKTGLNWLVMQQEEDGSWQHYPAITALAVIAILRCNQGLTADFEPVAEGLHFISECKQLDGSISIGDLPNYNTSICLTALKEARDEQYADLIDKAEKYLLNIQLDEGEGLTPDSLYYGGIGYDGSDNRPDLSNMQWVIESLIERQMEDIEKKEEKINNQEAKELFYEKALVFLERCQNYQEFNPEEYSENDGGFMYEAGKSKAGGVTSYGSMTYIGLKSMIYARLERDDPRVKAAYDWIKGNYSIESTPKMGNQGLFYYYQTMAKALRVYGEDIIIDKTGVSHNWRQELASQLISIQNEEGWWQNENGRWRENNQILVTAYSILALEDVLGNYKD